MKKILIVGANSYIGTNFESFINRWGGYKTDTLDTVSNAWENYDFSAFDCVFHVAGIAHVKETKKNAHLYYTVNRDLAVKCATKAKNCGVKQFVFLSSMSVYGMLTGVITKQTIPNPGSNYGKSKLQAESIIREMGDDNFKVAILRPPMVYGDGCKGNYQLLRKCALKSPVFPDIQNKRSMVHIEKLCDFVKEIIERDAEGIFYPQDDSYVCTSEMVFNIAESEGKRIKLTKLFNPIIKNVNFKLFDKVFGDLIYRIDDEK